MKFIPQWAWVLLNLWYVQSLTRRHVIKNKNVIFTVKTKDRSRLLHKCNTGRHTNEMITRGNRSETHLHINIQWIFVIFCTFFFFFQWSSSLSEPEYYWTCDMYNRRHTTLLPYHCNKRPWPKISNTILQNTEPPKFILPFSNPNME
jgi:hypothetical protein